MRLPAAASAILLLLAAAPALSQTTAGREFWHVETSASISSRARFGVLFGIANAGAAAATVTIANEVHGTRTLVIGPGEVAATDFPTVQQNATGVFTSNVFHVVSTADVTVTAFVPSRDMANNDATLLLPVSRLGTDHRLAGSLNPAGNSFANVAAVVAVLPGSTDVELHDSDGALVQAVALAQGQALQWLEGSVGLMPGAPPTDMTGWRVVSSRPVAVFTATDCSSILATGACDHLEDQAPPRELLGQAYLAAPTRLRPFGCTADCAPDLFRFVALEDGTRVTTEPDVGSAVLRAGGFLEVVTATPFVATATAPLQAWQFLLSHEAVVAGAPAPGFGDPSLVAIPAPEQFLDSYLLMAHDVPPPLLEFERDFLHLVVPDGARVMIDGTAVSGPCEPIGRLLGRDWCTMTVETTDGPHAVASDQPFGLSVLGFSGYSSYWALAGAGTRPIEVACSAGPPQHGIPCALDFGLDSTAACPDGSPPVLTWSSEPGVTFDDPSSATPRLHAPSFGAFEACLDVACAGRAARRCCTTVVADPGAALPLPELSAPGALVPLRVRRDGASLDLSFEPPPAGAGADVALGTIDGLRSSGFDHAAVACGLPGGEAILPMPAGDAYVLVHAGACSAPRLDGPLGATSAGDPRPAPRSLGRPACP